MFEKQELKRQIADLTEQLDNRKKFKYTEEQLQEVITKHEREIETLKHTHALEIKDKEFDFKNFKDNEILEKNEKIVELTNSNAVLVKENEMLNKMTDINADIVDVKEIINQLINKLPEVNLNSITVQSK